MANQITFTDPDEAQQPTPAATPAEPAPTPGFEPAEPSAAPAAGSTAEKVEDLPPWAQKQIRDARSEAAKYRTERTTAATAAEQALTDKLATALGLKPDAATDPAALTQQLTKAQQAQKDAAIQLAIFRGASKHGGNPDALLDSNTFLANVSALDPSAAEFPSQVSDAIKAAVTQNPTAFRIAQAAGASAADHAGGSGEAGPITEAQLAQMTPQQIDKAYREGRLKHLL